VLVPPAWKASIAGQKEQCLPPLRTKHSLIVPKVFHLFELRAPKMCLTCGGRAGRKETEIRMFKLKVTPTYEYLMMSGEIFSFPGIVNESLLSDERGLVSLISAADCIFFRTELGDTKETLITRGRTTHHFD
jgi:hypothetical protein